MSAPASERLARLLALVPWLVAHDGVTIEECAAHFGVTPEQLERDLWLLVVCGVPGYGPDQLVDIDFWDDGVIHVLDPQTLGRPLRLTHEEALTLLVALRMLAQLPGIDDREAILSAAAKIETLVGGLDRFVAVAVDVSAEVSAQIDRALAEGRAVDLRYAAATRDEITDRTVDPIRVIAVDGVGYLEAYCRSAEAVRTFRIDRIVSAAVGEPARPPAALGASAGGAPTPALDWLVLRLDPTARWVIDVHGGTEVLEEPGPDGGTTVVRVPMHSMEWGARLVLSLRGTARVIAPEAVAREVAVAARSALASYA